VSIQFGPEWQDIQRRLGSYPQVTEAQLRRTLTTSLLLIEGSARRNAAQDTRRLAGSITHEITGTYPQLVGRVGPTVRYGAVMEFGRRAGARMPPVDALLGWVRRHWTGTPLPRRGERREAMLRSRAFVIARAIGRRGIPARPYLQPAYRQNRAQIDALFNRIGVRIVAFLAGGSPP
jgi:phage gpG-like protein